MRLSMLLVCALLSVVPVPSQAPLRVCATTPDLGALCKAIGGELVQVTTFVLGPQDPHFIEARPSMIRELNRADALVEVGLELEIGWLPLLVDNARNSKVLLGAPGRIDASTVVERLGVPATDFNRASGDVHPGGNPHFVCDPVCGLRVAALLRDRLAALRPEQKGAFGEKFERFRQELCAAMVGPELASLYGYDVEQLGVLFAHDRLAAVLQAQGDTAKLGGWFAAMQPYRGSKVVADHDLWPYFADRFGLHVVGFFEPKPGIAPTTAHLEDLIKRMRAEQVRVILSSPYFAPQHAEFVARATGAKIAAMANQVGSRDDAGDYIACVGHNVSAVVGALSSVQ